MVWSGMLVVAAAMAAQSPPPLEIWVQRTGVGEECRQGDLVRVHFEAWVNERKVMDTEQRGLSYAFELGSGEAMPGLERGVLGMRLGEKRKLRIAPELAFGEKGHPPVIGPQAEVTLLVWLVDLRPGDSGDF